MPPSQSRCLSASPLISTLNMEVETGRSYHRCSQYNLSMNQTVPSAIHSRLHHLHLSPSSLPLCSLSSHLSHWLLLLSQPAVLSSLHRYLFSFLRLGSEPTLQSVPQLLPQSLRSTQSSFYFFQMRYRSVPVPDASTASMQTSNYFRFQMRYMDLPAALHCPL